MGAPKKLRVWGWQSFRHEPDQPARWDSQSREICAAVSKAAVGRAVAAAQRAAGLSPWNVSDDPRKLFNLDETGNAAEIEQAMSEPNTVFWHPINERESERKWRKA